MSDLVSRQEVIKELHDMYRHCVTLEDWHINGADAIYRIEHMPSAESEPAIPLSWIEGQIKWLKSLDNAFSTLTAVQISAMVNKWRGEQND